MRKRRKSVERVASAKSVDTAPLHLNAFERDDSANVAGVIRFDGVDSRHAANGGRSTSKVSTLDEFESSVLQLKTRLVKRTSLVGNENNALQSVNLDEEFQLVDNALGLKVSLRVVGQTGRPAGKCDAVIPWQLQTVLQEVIELFADATVRTVDRGSVDSRTLVRNAALIRQDVGTILHWWAIIRRNDKTPTHYIK